MALRDGLLLLGVSAVVAYGLGRVLINAFFAQKRKNQRELIRELEGDEAS